MDNAPGTQTDASPPTRVVEVNGCYGTAMWSVCKELYDILPRNDRDKLLDMTGERVIGPFFLKATDRLLDQAGCAHVLSASLCTDWSLETLEVSCRFGELIWQLGQGLWDSLPADQRENLLALMETIIHEFFEAEVLAPLFLYARRRMQS